MLEILLSLFLVQLVIGRQLKQILCVGHFTELVLGSTGNWPVIKADTFLAILLS